MTRGYVYAGVFYLALCLSARCSAQTVNTRMGDTEEKQADRMFLHVLSCEALESLGQRLADEVLRDESRLATPRCRLMGKVEPICRAYTQLRAEHMQQLTDVDEEEYNRCGLDRR